MPTIKDVATRAGVSTATVSYVLSGSRKVRPATEQKIRLAAEELSYRPNIAARNLALGRSHILGLLVPDIRNPFFPEVTTAFEEAATAHDMDVIVINSSRDIQRIRSTFNRLLGLRVPGAAFLTSRIDRSLKEQIAEKQICAVYLDHGDPGPYISGIAIDYEVGIFAAVEHVRALGHRRIGLVAGPADLDSARRRELAFIEGAGRDSHAETRVINSDLTIQGGYYACSKLLNGFPATAILAANDLMAIGAMHSLRDRGLRIPADISVVGFDDITFAQFTQPSLTTVSVPKQEIGRLAFEAMWLMINHPDHLGQSFEVKPKLVVRQSTCAPSQASIG